LPTIKLPRSPEIDAVEAEMAAWIGLGYAAEADIFVDPIQKVRGVFIIGADGAYLGCINTGEATANCAWGEDGSVLYITADMYICRVQTKTKGEGF